MNERDLFRAIGDVEDELVTAAGNPPSRKPVRVWLSGALAACLCVTLLVLAMQTLPSRIGQDNAEAVNPEMNGATGNVLYSTDEQEFSPETSKSGLHDGDFSHAGIQSSTQPTGGAILSSEIPADFGFTIAWAENSFDSTTGVLTENGGLSYTLSLTGEERYSCWKLLNMLEHMETDPNGDIRLTFTANDLTRELRFSQEKTPQASSLCDELLKVIEYAASRLR